MHKKEIITAGKNIHETNKALILIHGRGATAEDILGLGQELNTTGFAMLAPQATNYTWYPYSFLAPVKQNEPWLSSAINLLGEIVSDINKQGIPSEHIYLAGFSQGACLTLEFAGRHAQKWGGIAAFTGGLIGDKLNLDNYKGDFQNTPIFIGSSNPDPHIPVDRVQESTKVLRSLNADVIEKIYPNLGHTISFDEIAIANSHVFK
jgi:phospholipase/carboxylesterase